jgi:hypothetical protein
MNLFTIIMAGQLEFATRLAHPKRANLFQRVGTYCTLERIHPKEVVNDYVKTRLALAGTTKRIFTDDAIDELWKYSDFGVPRLINKMCKLSLKAGETNQLKVIDGNIISQIGSRFQKVSDQAPKRKAIIPEKTLEPPVEVEPKKAPKKVTRPAPGPIAWEPASPAPSPEPAPPSIRKSIPQNQPIAAAPVIAEPLATIPMTAAPIPEPPAAVPIPEYHTKKPTEDISPPAPPPPPPIVDEEVRIDQYDVQVNIPADVMTESRTFNDDQCIKLAGLLAAQTIQKHPSLTATWGTDPLAVWSEIREVILARIRQSQNGTAR